MFDEDELWTTFVAREFRTYMLGMTFWFQGTYARIWHTSMNVYMYTKQKLREELEEWRSRQQGLEDTVKALGGQVSSPAPAGNIIRKLSVHEPSV